MFTERPEFLYQVPILMVICQVLMVLAIKALLLLFRWLGVGSWTAAAGPRRAITFVVIGLVAVTPIRVLLVATLALLAVPIAQSVYFGLAMTRWGRRRLVEPRMWSRLRTLTESAWTSSPSARRPFLIRSWTRELEKIGFLHIATDDLALGIVRAILVRPDEGAVATIVWQPRRIDYVPLPPVSLLSVVARRRGALSTAVCWRFETCPTLITQQVAVITPSRLLGLHSQGRRLLEDRDVRFESVAPGSAIELSDWFSVEVVGHLLGLPEGSLVPRVRDAFRRRLLASQLDDPVMLRRIECLRGDAGEPTVPARVVRGSGPGGP